MEQESMRVTVIDMQPITPAVGGGRLRLLGLYHALGTGIECTYVGSYDWPGEKMRNQRLTPGLREIVVPLSPEHHAAAAELSRRVGGRTVIDIAFANQVALSPEFLRVAREHITSADVVVFSHPWCFPPLTSSLRNEQLVVYDSHNVEALLRAELLGDLDTARDLLAQVARDEQALLRRADLVLACSDDDVVLFQRIFETDPIKIRIVPNGTFVDRLPDPSAVDRSALRRKHGLPADRPIAIFLGSMYGPNADAARFIAQRLAPACPEIQFIVMGGVGEALVGILPLTNLRVTGRVDDAQRDELLLAADFALNPMNAGSGTNIKMFDYMAAGLPVLTTEIGARGIGDERAAPKGVFVEPLAGFQARCVELLHRLPRETSLREAVRETVRRRYSWERISRELGMLLRNEFACHVQRSDHRRRVAMLTTWNVTCGIGEHAYYLGEEIVKAGADLLVLGNDLTGHEPLGFEHDLHTAVSRAWCWDNLAWRGSGIDIERLGMLLRLTRPDLLIVQHHTAFVPFRYLQATVRTAFAHGIRVAAELHDARNLSDPEKNQLCSMGVELFVHHADELAGIAPCHANRAHVLLHPVRWPPVLPAPPPSGPNGVLTIGGFGFLRPYKGLPIMIETLALLRRRNHKVRYLGLHAIYHGDESERHLKECRELAVKLHVEDALEIDTDFLPIDQVAERLRATDVVVLPYNPSNEGASGAVNHALAVGRPVVVSPSAIFRPLSDVVLVTQRHDAEAYATALEELLTDTELRAELSQRATSWAESNSYARAALLFLDPGTGRAALADRRKQ